MNKEKTKSKKRNQSTPVKYKNIQLTEKHLSVIEKLDIAREKQRVIAKVKNWLEKCPELTELDLLPDTTDAVLINEIIDF